MHSASFDLEGGTVDGGDVLVAIAALVTEGRTPHIADKTCHSFYEGPHCYLSRASQGHRCDMNDAVCFKYNNLRSQVLTYWEKSVPVCIEVLMQPKCRQCNKSDDSIPAKLVEQWYLDVGQRRSHGDRSSSGVQFNKAQLIRAIRSQLHFSQISAWLSKKDNNLTNGPPFSIIYRLTVPGETYETCKFSSIAQSHHFPTVDISLGITANISLLSLPRTQEIPQLQMCSNCQKQQNTETSDSANAAHRNLFDDRMHTRCTLKGKHRCTDEETYQLDSPSTSNGFAYKFNCSSCHQKSPEPTKCSSFKFNMQHLSNPQPSSSSASQSKEGCSFKCQRQIPHQPTNKSDASAPNGFRVKSTTVAFHCQPSTSNVESTLETLNQQQKKACPWKGKQRCDFEPANENASEKLERRKPQLRLDISKVTTSSGGLDLELSSKELNEVLCVLQQQQPYHSKKLHQNQDDLKSGGVECCSMATATSGCGSASSSCKGDILLDAILRSSGSSSSNNNNFSRNEESKCVDVVRGDMNMKCDTNVINISDNKLLSLKDNIYVDVHCDRSARRRLDQQRINRKITFEDDSSSLLSCCKRETGDGADGGSSFTFAASASSWYQNNPDTEESSDDNGYSNGNNSNCGAGNIGIPSALEKAKFRKSLDNAASMVFHSRTGLPLTSSPAPVRRGKSCFDFDSSINSVSAIRSALFSLGGDEDSESDCSVVSPCSPDFSTSSCSPLEGTLPGRNKYHRKGQAANLLGSFEESVLNGRLEPDSTVHGFTAELGASGSFVPRHLAVPVTVFFYTLGDMSSPYLGHINLGKKGYNVPKTGTVQVTLFNPLRTVVKMFVIMYDLSDMPANSQTFIRQRTLYMPINCPEPNMEWGQKWLRYLIHLRFMSSKSGRIYLHSDIRMIIFRKSDLDTATAHGLDMSYELRSFTHTPSNPKYSPRK